MARPPLPIENGASCQTPPTQVVEWEGSGGWHPRPRPARRRSGHAKPAVNPIACGSNPVLNPASAGVLNPALAGGHPPGQGSLAVLSKNVALVRADQATEIGGGPSGPRGPERDSTSPRRCWSTWTKSRARLSGRHPTLRTLSSRSQSPISNLTPTWLRGCRGLKRAGHVPRPSTDPVRSSIGRRPRDAGAKGQCPRHRPSSPCSVPSPRRNRWTRFGSARCRRSCRGRFRVR
jgi:hypothetical protein